MAENILRKLLEKYIQSKKQGATYILKLTNEVSYSQETIKGFKKIVSEVEDLYPGIDKWFDKKVITGISEGSRYAFLLVHKGQIIAETIVKPNEDSKLCSMRIKPNYQNKSLGTVLFAEVAKTLENCSKRIHFTAPESLVYQREGLFNRLGFQCVGKSPRFYRRGEDEFVFRAVTMEFKKRSKFLLQENIEDEYNNFASDDMPIVMSIKPEFAFGIIRKTKTIEIRRKFSNNIKGNTIFIYATMPTGSIIGEAKIARVVEDKPKNIWESFREGIGCSHKQYIQYCHDLNTVKAIILEDVIEYREPLPWAVFSTTFNAPVRPPQSYQFIRPTGFKTHLHSSYLKDDPQLEIFTPKLRY